MYKILKNILNNFKIYFKGGRGAGAQCLTVSTTGCCGFDPHMR